MFRKLFRDFLASQIRRQMAVSTRASHWSYGNLEERVLLAADAGVAVVDAMADDQPAFYASMTPVAKSQAAAEIATTPKASDQSSEVLRDSRTRTLVFVDSRVEDLETVVADAARSAEVVVVPENVSGLQFVTETLGRYSSVPSIHIIGHGQSGFMQLGSDGINQKTIESHQHLLARWKESVSNQGDILLYGCETGAGTSGQALVNSLAQLTQLDVGASSDLTGAENFGANWRFETTVGDVDASAVFSDHFQNSYSTTLFITVFAAGQTGDERMELQIDGRTVASWDGVGGNINEGVFESFTYLGDTTGLTPDRVRVAFTNDSYDGDINYDRNLTVKSILIDEVAIETNSSQVFGAGVFNPQTNSIDSGFLNQNTLYVNGYFQYAPTVVGNNEILIQAAGDTGEEQMQVFIDDQLVATFDNVQGNAGQNNFITYRVETEGSVSIDRIRIAFTNDAYDPANGVDRNLHIQSVTVGNQTYQSNAPSVFTTGTYNPATEAIRPGFFSIGTLHTSGYMTFDSEIANQGSEILIRASGSVGGERMNLRIGDEIVRTWVVERGADQLEYQWYAFRASQTVDIDDIFIEFTGDEYSETVDKNLRVDFVSLDGEIYQTEAPTVFSTGSWIPAGIFPGYWGLEYLNTDGYFQFSTSPVQGGSVAIANNRYTVSESASLIQIPVVRTGGSDGTLIVDYTTVAGTATAGQDFVGTTGQLVFLPGQTTATIRVDLLNDTVYEGNETFNVTIDNLRGPGTLAAPRTATVLISDNDTVLPNFANFNTSTGMTLAGTTALDNGTLRLTPATGNAVGSAFFGTALPVSSTTSFQSSFGFRVDGGQGTSGADGFAFVIQNAPAGASAIATSAGGSLGYMGITNSLAIEFDTYQNPGEISANHISISINGSSTPLITRNVDIDLNSGSNLRAWVDYNGDSRTLAIYLSNSATKPEVPITTATIDLAGIVGNRAFLGFTAATGGSVNAHRILDWSVNLTPPVIVNPPPGTNLANETVASGFQSPTAIEFSPDGRNMYVAQQNGIVHLVRDGQRQATPFIDISAQVNGTRDRGLLDIAIHPDFEDNPYVYLLFTYDPPEVFQNTSNNLAGPDRNGNRAGRLIRVTADAATNYTTAVAGSEVVLLGKNSVWANFNAFANSTNNFNEPPAGIRNGVNIQDFIASDSESHTVGSLAFGLDGALFVSIGDGTSYNQVDPRTVRVQDIDNLSGKILRIDPITGEGLADNPFFNGDANANRSKVYQLGLRNPFRITVDSATGKLYVGDVGWTQWEEINSAGPGANYGWPYYEGGNGSSIRTSGYQNLAAAQTFYASGTAVQAPLLGLNHAATGINAIVAGAVYRGSTYPAHYQGDLFFNDLGQGIVSNISFNADGSVAQVQTFVTGANYVVQITQGVDGNLYYVDLDDGRIGRWIFV